MALRLLSVAGAQVHVRPEALLNRSLRAHLIATNERWRRGSGRSWVAPVLVAVASITAVLLWTSELSGLHVVAAEAFLLGYAGTLLVRHLPSHRFRRCPALLPILDLVPLTLLFGAVACTGGVHSPLLLAMVTMAPLHVLSGGWSRRTRSQVVLICGAALAMAIAPSEWLGPQLPPRTFAAIAALALATGVVLLSHNVGFIASALEGAVHDALTAREQATAQALARSREMENICARISHELKQPLAVIEAARLWPRAAKDPEEREQLATLASEAARMRQILDEYLSLSRPLESLRLEPVSLGNLVREVLEAVAAPANEAQVTTDATGDAVVAVDRRRLKEALLNLVANALEATPPGGRVGVTVSREGGVARIAVADNGAGMAHDVLERIGTPFFTTREWGTGLGVLLARAVFTQHGGGLTYQSSPGGGTTVVATLPVTTAK